MKRVLSVILMLALLTSACLIFASCNREEPYYGPVGYYKADGFAHDAYEFDENGGVTCYKAIKDPETLKYAYVAAWSGSYSLPDGASKAVFTYTENGEEITEEIRFSFYRNRKEEIDYITVRGVRMNKVVED